MHKLPSGLRRTIRRVHVLYSIRTRVGHELNRIGHCDFLEECQRLGGAGSFGRHTRTPPGTKAPGLPGLIRDLLHDLRGGTPNKPVLGTRATIGTCLTNNHLPSFNFAPQVTLEPRVDKKVSHKKTHLSEPGDSIPPDESQRRISVRLFSFWTKSRICGPAGGRIYRDDCVRV